MVAVHALSYKNNSDETAKRRFQHNCKDFYVSGVFMIYIYIVAAIVCVSVRTGFVLYASLSHYLISSFFYV